MAEVAKEKTEVRGKEVAEAGKGALSRSLNRMKNLLDSGRVKSVGRALVITGIVVAASSPSACVGDSGMFDDAQDDAGETTEDATIPNIPGLDTGSLRPGICDERPELCADGGSEAADGEMDVESDIGDAEPLCPGVYEDSAPELVLEREAPQEVGGYEFEYAAPIGPGGLIEVRCAEDGAEITALRTGAGRTHDIERPEDRMVLTVHTDSRAPDLGALNVSIEVRNL